MAYYIRVTCPICGKFLSIDQSKNHRCRESALRRIDRAHRKASIQDESDEPENIEDDEAERLYDGLAMFEDDSWDGEES